jgi:ribosome modulation factor
MLVDVLMCPYIEMNKRKKWLKRFYKVYGEPAPGEHDMEDFLRNDERQYWFTNWHEVDLLNALERKELRQVY